MELINSAPTPNASPTSSSRCSAVLSCICARSWRPGMFPFPQFFLLAALDQKEVLTMSAIAQKMGHTTAAASGLVDRLENLGYVVRSSAREDRRKVMVCITEKGIALVRRIREEMVGQPDEGDDPPHARGTERRGSRFTRKFTTTARRRKNPSRRRRVARRKSFARVAAFRKWNTLIPNPGRISEAANSTFIFLNSYSRAV